MPLPLSGKRKDDIAKEVLLLRRRPENMKCADCSNRNIPYVCTNFDTFICSDCAGLYRKYSFRVKSCTVATFSEEEYLRLKSSGGNKASNRKYMALWKKKVMKFPTQGDLSGWDDFIRRKYVQKEWYSNVDKMEKEKEKKRKKKKKKQKHFKEELDDDVCSSQRGSLCSTSSRRKRTEEIGFQEDKDNWASWGQSAHSPSNEQIEGSNAYEVNLSSANKTSNHDQKLASINNIGDWNPWDSEPVAPGVETSHQIQAVSTGAVDLLGDLISNMNVAPGETPNIESAEENQVAEPKPVKKEKKQEDPFFTMMPQGFQEKLVNHGQAHPQALPNSQFAMYANPWGQVLQPTQRVSEGGSAQQMPQYGRGNQYITKPVMHPFMGRLSHPSHGSQNVGINQQQGIPQSLRMPQHGGIPQMPYMAPQGMNMYNRGVANQRFMMGQQFIGRSMAGGQGAPVGGQQVQGFGMPVQGVQPTVSSMSSVQSNATPNNDAFNVGEGVKVSEDNPFL